MNRWEYLVTKEFQLRQYVCEYYFDDAEYIIDVGAYRKTFNRKNVIAIDPLETMEDSFHGSLKQWYDSNELPSDYVVVVMGLHIEGDDEELNTLIDLIKKSKRAIIEYPIDHQPSVDQFNFIIQQTNFKCGTVVDFSFPEMETLGFKPFLNRKLTILER